ncbi:hypothetical protein D3C81_1006840 [compost metagenome]
MRGHAGIPEREHAGGAPFLEQAVEVAVEIARHGVEPRHGVRLQVLVVAETQRRRHVAAHAAPRHLQQAAVQALAHGQCRVGGLADHGQAGLRRLAAQDVEDLVLVSEVVIDRRLGHPERPAQVVHGHAGVALGVEELGGGIQDLAAARFLALGNVRARRTVVGQRGGFIGARHGAGFPGGGWHRAIFSCGARSTIGKHAA